MDSLNDSLKDSVKESGKILFASVISSPFWWPLYELRLEMKAQVLKSSYPGSIRHINYFYIPKYGEVTITQRLDNGNLKIRTRVDEIGTTRNIKHLYSAYFKVQPIVQPLSAITILSLQHLQKKYNPEKSKVKDIGLTFGLGATTGLMCNPFVRIVLDAHKRIYEPFSSGKPGNGLKYLFRGSFLYSVRNGMFFSSLIPFQKEINNYTNNILLSAIISSAICNTVTIPIDVITTMIQSNNYKLSSYECFKAVLNKFGWRGFTIGYGLGVIERTIEFSIFNFIYTKLTSKVSP
jgi:hypothetical protein